MRALILAAGAVLALSACGGEKAKTNTMTTGNTMSSNDMMMAPAPMGDPMMNGSSMNGSMPVDPTTANMMRQDMNTNAPDTNLANGM